MTEIEASCRSHNFEFLRTKCLASDKYEDIDYDRLGLMSTFSKIQALSKQKDNEYSDADDDLISCELAEHVTSNLLAKDLGLIQTRPEISKKLKKIEQDYKIVTEEFSVMLNRWLKLRKDSINALRKSEQKFRLIHRTTTCITLISSALELAVSVGLILKAAFHLNVDISLPVSVVPILGGISLTSSLLALSHSKTTLMDIGKGLRDEKRLRRDLEMMYRKGKWIDKAVQNLFPFGIDLNLLRGTAVEKQSWRHQVCSAIVLTNIKRDLKTLDDEDFLPTVKAFLESPAAQIWFNRIKLRKLLDAMFDKCESLPEETVASGTKVFLSGVALNLLPVFCPMLTTENLRIVYSSVTAVKSAKDLLNNRDEFQEMRDTTAALREEFKKIRKMNRSLISDYD